MEMYDDKDFSKGEPGEPGQPGEPGSFGQGGTGGRGGRGGAGGITGGIGGMGGPGGKFNKNIKFRSTIIALLMTLLFLGVYYTSMFHMREESILNCQDRNEQIREVNQRAEILNLLIKLEQGEVGEEHVTTPNARANLISTHAEKVTLSVCSKVFDKPWPFNKLS